LDALLCGLDLSAAEALGLNSKSKNVSMLKRLNVGRVGAAAMKLIVFALLWPQHAPMHGLKPPSLSFHFCLQHCSISDKPPPPDPTTVTPGQLREELASLPHLLFASIVVSICLSFPFDWFAHPVTAFYPVATAACQTSLHLRT
jgi:hypothetical protein